MTSTRIAVLCGGRSSEHAISCISAAGILRALDRTRYEVRVVGITRDGRWRALPDDPALLDRSERGLPEITDDASTDAPGPRSLPGDLLDGVDVVFPVLHGPWGEDGTVQGVLETAGLPYVGSGVLASAAAMDKAVMKSLLRAAGLPVGPWVAFGTLEWAQHRPVILERIEALGFPVFVKPCRAGSSVGISRVHNPQDLPTAIEEARRWDPRVIVEAQIAPAREIECGVIVDERGTPKASVCAEIRVGGGHEFYDFAAKYLDDAADLIVPAVLDADVQAAIAGMSTEAFAALGCEGLARVDFFLTAAGPIVNEVNTMPGFTPISMFPRMWAASGMPYGELVDHLLADALRRGTGLR